MTAKPAVTFLGAGRMATALARAWVAAGLIDTARSIAADTLPAACETFAAATGIPVTDSNAAAMNGRDIVLLAVKPQVMPAVLKEIQPAMTDACLVISIAAGIGLKTLADGLGQSKRIIRVMPNTPCLVNAGAAGFAANDDVTAEDLAMVSTLFGAVGVALAVPERLIDAVTGLSGSGPAYVFTLIEAMSDGGVKMGLPRDVALKLAAQTVLGAARMVLETDEHPAALKDAVTSPGGTTIAGLHALEEAGFRAAVMNAVEAATMRAVELGK